MDLVCVVHAHWHIIVTVIDLNCHIFLGGDCHVFLLKIVYDFFYWKGILKHLFVTTSIGKFDIYFAQSGHIFTKRNIFSTCLYNTFLKKELLFINCVSHFLN